MHIIRNVPAGINPEFCASEANSSLDQSAIHREYTAEKTKATASVIVEIASYTKMSSVLKQSPSPNPGRNFTYLKTGIVFKVVAKPVC